MTNGNVPLIAKNNVIAILADTDFPNTTEAENEAFFENLPKFQFQQPIGGPAGYVFRPDHVGVVLMGSQIL